MMETTRKKPKRGRPSAQDKLRERLAKVEKLGRCPTNEAVARQFNALLDALRGDD